MWDLCGQSGAGAGFLRVLWFPLPIFIPPISPQSPSPIIQGWYNRPVVAAVPIVSPHKWKKKKVWFAKTFRTWRSTFLRTVGKILQDCITSYRGRRRGLFLFLGYYFSISPVCSSVCMQPVIQLLQRVQICLQVATLRPAVLTHIFPLGLIIL
jgi:hypothetical protein